MNRAYTILVVDDEPDFLEFVAWQLSDQGYKVLTAESGQAALDKLEENGVHILIADIRMPGMDGITLIKKAVSLRPDIQCIVITGHGGMETAVEAMRAGAVNYLQKPAGMEEIEVAIQKGIEKLELIRAVREKQERLEKANAELERLRRQLEDSLEKETAGRKQAEAELYHIRLRQTLVEVMTIALRCWKEATGKSKIDLAEESRIWTASVDSGGTYRTRTLDRYLKVGSLPPNPRSGDVMDTAYFVMSHCDGRPEMSARLANKIEMLETLMVNAP